MYQKKTALITGATSGIGFECARILADLHYQLILVARNKERLQEVVDSLPENTEAHVIISDLALPAAAVEVMTGIQELQLDVDVLINNAGVGLYGKFADTDMTKEEDMMQLNMTTVVQLTKLVLPQMLERGEGKILNVASTAAFFPGPLMSIYYATKAFVLSFSEGLSEELRGSGVTVTALCPGPTETGFEQKAELNSSHLFKGRLASARDVARQGIDAMLKGRRVVITGKGNYIILFFSRFVPRSVLARVVAFMQRPLHAK